MSKKNKTRKSVSNFSNISYFEFFKSEVLKLLKFGQSPCPFNKCNKPCSDNIYCLNGLFDKNDFTDHDAQNDDNYDCFDKSLPRGLQNFGNTCYLNSFLQIYFHISKFRQIMYESFIPDDCTVMKDLQKLFAQMQFSSEPVLHPSDIIEDLSLSEHIQQDAPEFHSLFMTVLDSSFSHINDGVGSLFTGQQNYVTRCKDCNYTSSVDSEFRELSLKPLSTLDASLQDFLKPEVLTGDNLYSCPQCKKLTCGERSTIIKVLPSVLCIQFLRYSFHDSAGKQKSSAAVQFPEVINMKQYMKCEKGGDKKQSIDYVLKAILLHIGDKPSSGHYQCILHNKNNEWILCDDSIITVMDDNQALQKVLLKNNSYTKKISLSSLPSTSSQNSNSNGQLSNLMLTSTNAYMLFYETKAAFESYEDEITNLEIPVPLKSIIEDSNVKSESLRESIKLQTVIKKQIWKSRGEVVERCLASLSYDEPVTFDESKYSEVKATQLEEDSAKSDQSCDEPCLISLKSLRNALRYFEIENESWGAYTRFADNYTEDNLEQCKHNTNKLGCKSSVTNCANLRLVRRKGLDELVKNQIIANLKSINIWKLNEDLCQVCWRMNFAKKRLDMLCKLPEYTRLLEKYKRIPEITETSDIDDKTKTSDLFWVSKYALKKWKILCLQSISHRYQEDQEANSSSNNVEEVFPVNGDLICTSHRCLVRGRPGLQVNSTDWKMLLNLMIGFDDSVKNEDIVLTLCVAESEFCQRCSVEYSPSDRAKKEIESLRFLKQTNKLKKLKKRFVYCPDEELLTVQIDESNSGNYEFENQSPLLYLDMIPSTFVNDWKKFIRDPSKESIIQELDYSEIECDHVENEEKQEFLIYKPWHILHEQGVLQLIYLHEMDKIRECYPNLIFEPIRLCFEPLYSTKQSQQSNTKSGGCQMHYKFNNIKYIPLMSMSKDDAEKSEDDDLVCKVCYDDALAKEKSYNDAVIFVRLLNEMPSNTNNTDSREDTNTMDATASEQIDEQKDDPVVYKNGDQMEVDQNDMPPPKKKKLTCEENNKSTQTPTTQPISYSGNVRRSIRSKKHPDDVSVRINSDATVKDLKVKLMNLFQVSPLDQYLYFDQLSLDQNDATMVDIGVQPSSVLSLFLSDRNNTDDNTNINNKTSIGNNFQSAKTRSGGYIDSDLYSEAQTVETGFRGTKLVDG